MIEGISAVTLGAHEMPRAVRFYRVLGFEILHGGEESSFTSFRAGASYLNLIAQPAGLFSVKRVRFSFGKSRKQASVLQALSAWGESLPPWALGLQPNNQPETDVTLPEYALTRLAAEDPAIHTLTAEVQNLLRPRSVYRDPALVQRVLAKMTEA